MQRILISPACKELGLCDLSREIPYPKPRRCETGGALPSSSRVAVPFRMDDLTRHAQILLRAIVLIQVVLSGDHPESQGSVEKRNKL